MTFPVLSVTGRRRMKYMNINAKATLNRAMWLNITDCAMTSTTNINANWSTVFVIRSQSYEKTITHPPHLNHKLDVMVYFLCQK